ncbi:MAG: response regulator transcription factor [Pirellulaceae bacterium]
MKKRGVLLIGEPRAIDQSLADGLRQAGLEVRLATNGREALELALEMQPEVVLLASQVPPSETFDLGRSIARNLPDELTPAILVLPDADLEGPLSTGVSEDTQLARSLAIDMLAQSVRTLAECARGPERADSRIECHGILLDAQRQEVTVDGALIPLTPTEFRMLKALMSRPGFVLTREELGGTPEPKPPPKPTGEETAAARTRKIDVHVKSIRTKLDEKGEVIETVRGVGYRMKDLSSVATSCG